MQGVDVCASPNFKACTVMLAHGFDLMQRSPASIFSAVDRFDFFSGHPLRLFD